MMRIAGILVAMLLGVCAGPSFAHESQPGTLDIKQLTADRYDVIWRAPIYYGKPHPARLILPGKWKNIVQPTERRLPDAIVYHSVVDTGPEGLAGMVVRFPGLEATITDVYVRLTRLDNTTMTAIVRPTRPIVELRDKRPWYVTAGDYIALGFHHILLGVDHLLFVLGLLLIVQGRLILVKTITSFTVAHSITLAMATLGFARIPLPPLNATVALSIVVVQ